MLSITDSQENAVMHVCPNREHSEDDEDCSLAIMCSDIYVSEDVDDDDVYEWVADWASKLISDTLGREVEVTFSGGIYQFDSGEADESELNLEI
jgi:hypothetical protein